LTATDKSGHVAFKCGYLYCMWTEISSEINSKNNKIE